jgi:hypothetical protein
VDKRVFDQFVTRASYALQAYGQVGCHRWNLLFQEYHHGQKWFRRVYWRVAARSGGWPRFGRFDRHYESVARASLSRISANLPAPLAEDGGAKNVEPGRRDASRAPSSIENYREIRIGFLTRKRLLRHLDQHRTRIEGALRSPPGPTARDARPSYATE